MKIIVIGGGPAGCIAAITASKGGNEVHIIEKNEKLGKKLFITGKGRCNITNASDMKTVMDSVVSNPKFMYSAFSSFTNDDIIKLLNENGCPTKVERGRRVFPVSDKSVDVIRAIERMIKTHAVKVRLNTEVKSLIIEDGVCKGVKTSKGESIQADRVIIATGGISYPSTGSTGDGYRFAEAARHKVTDVIPSLVPFETERTNITSGVSLKNVTAKLYNDKKLLYEELGEMMFTHFGVSGPLILSSSAYAADILKKNSLRLVIDLKPGLDEEKLDARLLRDFEKNKNKELKNALGELLISSLIDEVIRQSGISPYKTVNEITRAERESLLKTIKNLTFTVTGTRGFNEAVITRGGVSTKEINPKTMESKKIKNLFFAGEVIDVDALTGGYNLQIAWSTGYMAGMGAGEETE